jgi:O-antigen ligase
LSQFGRSLSKPVLLLAATGYFAFLFLALIALHLEPDVILALTVAGVGLIVMSLRPYLGLHVFILTLFVENVVGSSEEISPMKVLGMVILLGWLVSIAVRRRTGLKFDAFAAVLLLFVVWCGVSLVYAMDTRVALGRSFQFVQYALLTLMFSSVVDTPDRVRRVYWSFALCTIISTVVAVVMYYLGMTASASGFVGNRNLLAIYINIAIVCAYLLYQEKRQDPSRFVLLAALPLLFLGIGLTLSRGGLITLALTLVAVWYRVARQRGFILLAASIGMIGLLTYVLPSAFWKRAESIVPAIRRQQDTFGSRVKLWTAAMRMVEDRPLLGVGPGNFVKVYSRYARGSELLYQNLSSHNAFIGLAAEHGVPGAVLFLLLFGFALRSARRSIRIGRATARSDLELHSVVVEVSLLALAMAGLTGDVYGVKSLWMFFGVAVAMQRMAYGVVSEKTVPAARGSAAEPMERTVSWALARHPR